MLKCSSTLKVHSSATKSARDVFFGYKAYFLLNAEEWERTSNCESLTPDVGEMTSCVLGMFVVRPVLFALHSQDSCCLVFSELYVHKTRHDCHYHLASEWLPGRTLSIQSLLKIYIAHILHGNLSWPVQQLLCFSNIILGQRFKVEEALIRENQMIIRCVGPYSTSLVPSIPAMA